MCGRFYIRKSSEIQPYIDKAAKSSLTSPMTIALSRPLRIEGEIRPTDIVSVIAPSKSGREAVFPMVWGFSIAKTTNPIVNARVETVKDRDLFKDSWAHRRCIIPCSWYYEWEHLIGNAGQKKNGDKYMIQPRGSSMTWLAGLYRIEDGLPVFTVLTKEPTDELRRIHDRMPLILPQDLIDDWIRPDTNPKDLLQYAVSDLVVEKAG